MGDGILGEKMRLDKLLALLGEGTRSEIKAMVRAGRVTVDGAGARDAGMQVDGAQSDVRLDGRRLCYKAVRHVMLNKPSGVLTAARDKKQKTVMDLLPPMYAAMGAMPAGRLDKDTEGLLVITSDGQLAHRIISPRHEVGKVYYARLDGELTDEDVAALETGIHIRDADGEFDARPAKLRRDGGDAAYIRVTEGKYHQVKRMFAARGKHVVYLKRMAIGSLALDPELKPGEWRELTDDEVALLETEQFDGDFGTLDGIANETKRVGAVKLTKPIFLEKTKYFCPKVSKEVFGCCCQWQKQTIENGKPFGGAMGQSPISKNA